MLKLTPMKTTKYIIAMLASNPTWFVNYAQLFAGQSAGYLLGEHALPHVTLVQFYGEESDYNAVFELLKAQPVDIQPRITGLNFGYHTDSPDLLWAALGVARDPQLLALHHKLVDFLEQRAGVEVLTIRRDLYDPHITLALIKGNIPKCQRPIAPLMKFKLVLGRADRLGQFVEIYDTIGSNKPPEKCRL